MRFLLRALAALGLLLHAGSPLAEPGLENCASAFPGGTVERAPAMAGVDPEADPIHICKRSGETSFFALAYDPARLATLWVAYRLSDTFGADRCRSVPRRHMQCFFQAGEVSDCVATGRQPGDPFHAEPILLEQGVPHLRPDAFRRTRHDRGHLAPNNAFSWHLCGAYKTFTMANMAPQRDYLNRVTWQRLEAQVLHWGVTLGPLHVVTGPIWTRFPEEAFEAFDLDLVDRELMAQPGEPLRPEAGEGEPPILRPTGFFKVIYRPATEAEDAQAVAFLLPHTHEHGLSFWSFIATVAVVEEASGLTFGFDERLKHGGRQGFWLARRMPEDFSVRAPESTCESGYRAEGWFPALGREARRALCAGSLFEPPATVPRP